MLKGIVQGSNSVRQGYRSQYDGQLVALSSSPSKSSRETGAVLTIDNNGEFNFSTFQPVMSIGEFTL